MELLYGKRPRLTYEREEKNRGRKKWRGRNEEKLCRLGLLDGGV